MKTQHTLNTNFMSSWKEGEAEPKLLIPHRAPRYAAFTHSAFSLGGVGETLPCPHFTSLWEIPALCNLIVSFVSIIVSEHW